MTKTSKSTKQAPVVEAVEEVAPHVEHVEATTTATEGEGLGITDLKNVVKIIDHAAEQGAFKSWSIINQVQAVRNKFQAFIDYADQQAAQEG